MIQNVLTTNVFIHNPKGLKEVGVDLEDHFRGNYRGAGATGRKEPIKGTRSNGTRSNGTRSDGTRSNGTRSDGTRSDERKDTKSEERTVKRKNPTDSCGKVTTYNLCGSVYHWVRGCPMRESYEEEGTNLYSDEIQRQYLPIFLKETLNCAVPDCGCVRSVCEKKWLESYVKSLAPDNVKSIQEVPGHTRFRFGVGGLVYESEKRVKFPATVGTRRVFQIVVVSDLFVTRSGWNHTSNL